MSGQKDTGNPDEPAEPLTRLRLLGRQWSSAAENAFAALASSPERYLAAGHWVAAWLEQLRSLPPGQDAGQEPGEMEAGEGDDAVAALLAAWDARDSAAPVPDTPAPLTAAERSALTAAAFAIRYAEVAGWLTARRRRRAMAASVGPGWLVLDESGDATGNLFIPYRRLEVDPATGFGVLVETRPDDRFVSVVHDVHIVRVDLASGVLAFEEPNTSWEFSSPEEREKLVASLRAGDVHGDGRRKR